MNIAYFKNSAERKKRIQEIIKARKTKIKYSLLPETEKLKIKRHQAIRQKMITVLRETYPMLYDTIKEQATRLVNEKGEVVE